MNKHHILLAIFSFIILNSFISVEAKFAIPDEADDLFFESSHYLIAKNQVEFFSYKKIKDHITLKIKFEKNYYQAKTSKEKYRYETYKRRQDHILNILNYNDFLELPAYIKDPNKKADQLQTISKFKLTYRYNGMSITKEVTIENLENQVEKNPSKDVLRIKFIMLIIDKYKSSIYQYRKMKTPAG